jgi:hypothetical protein
VTLTTTHGVYIATLEHTDTLSRAAISWRGVEMYAAEGSAESVLNWLRDSLESLPPDGSGSGDTPEEVAGRRASQEDR